MFIVVEGKSDEEFLRQYILYNDFNVEFNFKQNGSNSLNNDTITQIQKELDNKKRICIIFDTDKSHINTLNRIKNELVNLANKVDIFLFPNNKDKGELETLLLDIARQPQFVECFDNYVKCVESKDISAADNIHKKSKMFAYREASGLEKFLKKLKDNDKIPRNFLENNKIFNQYFDFDSPRLEPLRNFLCKP